MHIRIPDYKVDQVRAALEFIGQTTEAATGIRASVGTVAANAIIEHAARIGGDLPDWRGGTLAKPNTPAGSAQVIRDAASQADATLDATRARLKKEMAE